MDAIVREAVFGVIGRLSAWSSFRDAPKAQARNPFDHLRCGKMDSGFALSRAGE
jgi:hypothetical protein